MKGLQILLQSFGIKIDPAQIEDAFAKGKDALPKIAQAFDELNARMNRMEIVQSNINDKLSFLMARTDDPKPDPVHEDVLGGVDPNAMQNMIVNGGGKARA